MTTEEVLKVLDGLMSEHAFFEYRAKPPFRCVSELDAESIEAFLCGSLRGLD
jgi:hypothetical protein